MSGGGVIRRSREKSESARAERPGLQLIGEILPSLLRDIAAGVPPSLAPAAVQLRLFADELDGCAEERLAA